MAYNKKNYYKRVIEIQDLTRNLKIKRGLTYRQIYHIFIENKYKISYKTFSNYIGVASPRTKLQQAIDNDNKQLKLNF